MYRRLFPTLRVRVGGLAKLRNYVLLVDVVPADQYRYRYEYSAWFIAGITGTDYGRGGPARVSEDARPAAGDPPSCQDSRQHQPPPRCYVHPDSPATGDHWMRQSVISFHRVKLTNNAQDQHGNVNLSSPLSVLFSILHHSSCISSKIPNGVCNRVWYRLPPFLSFSCEKANCVHTRVKELEVRESDMAMYTAAKQSDNRRNYSSNGSKMCGVTAVTGSVVAAIYRRNEKGQQK